LGSELESRVLVALENSNSLINPRTDSPFFTMMILLELVSLFSQPEKNRMRAGKMQYSKNEDILSPINSF